MRLVNSSQWISLRYYTLGRTFFTFGAAFLGLGAALVALAFLGAIAMLERSGYELTFSRVSKSGCLFGFENGT